MRRSLFVPAPEKEDKNSSRCPACGKSESLAPKCVREDLSAGFISKLLLNPLTFLSGLSRFIAIMVVKFERSKMVSFFRLV